jgi:hypothetical protein
MAPSAFLWTTWNEITGVGVSRSVSRTFTPFAQRTLAADDANSLELKRVSWPIITTGGAFLEGWCAFT